ncbi:hypothetical protein JWS13_04495 (plasmid) [Rhodococcus pseudokoreensis]|uniref:DUF4347 domain-containing protein n=1 Tax=Rhodococcus pseudokoreensis TaxID=2811421 RepID=A0A974ZRN4_9NOCA|nr:hypothetical protein [Rhodococcus pseudokoreensis]QSE87881.1 hypothetical protein JWS13_04495 [Rhodococcus pseudokoreensis]
MVSELEGLCSTLEGIEAEIREMALIAARQADQLATTAIEVAAVRGQVGAGTQLGPAVHAFGAASQACRRAAQLLDQSRTHGREFRTRIIGEPQRGGPSVATASRSDANADASADVDDVTVHRLFTESSYPIQADSGRCFLAVGDPLRPLTDTIPAVRDGSFLAVIHGNGSEVGIGPQSLNAMQLASLIRRDPHYTAGQPVTLFSCSTGSTDEGVAQQLARALGSRVTAPTDSVWLPPNNLGKIVISPGNSEGRPIVDTTGKGMGRWRTFHPA